MSLVDAFRRLLAHPLTRSLDIDSPATTEVRRQIVLSNSFLRKIYDEWCRMIAMRIPAGDGAVLEIGSGPGFLKDYIPNLICSEVFTCSNVHIALDARRLPFRQASLKSIVMIDVMHHIPDSRAFLSEADRCLRPGGSIIMIEPWVSRWSKLIYRHLHHEPFDPRSEEWTFPEAGPLSGANGALPWIVFERDRGRFESEFRDLTVKEVSRFMPFRYLVSGGVSMRQLMPGFMFRPVRAAEALFDGRAWAMFALVQLTRTSGAGGPGVAISSRNR